MRLLTFKENYIDYGPTKKLLNVGTDHLDLDHPGHVFRIGHLTLAHCSTLAEVYVFALFV